jgi:hypothetical protein
MPVVVTYTFVADLDVVFFCEKAIPQTSKQQAITINFFIIFKVV